MALVDAARPFAEGSLVVDLSRCHYVSSVGLAALVRVSQAHGCLPVVSPADHLAFDKLLALTGIERLFVVCGSREEACARAIG